MPIDGAADAALLQPVLTGGLGPLAGADWFDAHTHIGANDPDGRRATIEELIGGLDAAGHAGALVFAMHEPDGYREANDAVLQAVADRPGRLAALVRVDPGRPGAHDEARRGLDAGARGIKLHPRSDGFLLPHPVVEDLVALAAERRGIVLFHAGRGIPRLGATVVDLAGRHPDARLVLAHAGISDLADLREHVGTTPNVFFDTSWWQVSDLLSLVTAVPPGQILYASDMPYGPGLLAAFAFARVTAQAGLAPDIAREMAGPQLRRLLAGEDALDLGGAPGEAVLGARSVAVEQVVAYLTAACGTIYAGQDAVQSLSLARAAIPTGADGALGSAAGLIEQALERHAVGGVDPHAGLVAALAAHLVAGTPAAGATPLAV